MSKKGIFFERVHNTRVIPVTLKIVIIFSLFILVSNFTSNYINLMYNRSHQIKMTKELLAKDLKDIYGFSNTQYEIYKFNRNREGSFENIRNKARLDLKNSRALTLGITPKGLVEITASNDANLKEVKIDADSVAEMNSRLAAGEPEGFVTATINGSEYFGIYKYNSKWDLFILRAEDYNEFSAESRRIFRRVSMIILIITLLCTIVGIFVLRHILRFIRIITHRIMEMIRTQQLGLIPLKGAPNDDITYLGVAFNSLSSTIDTLLRIFRKFANQDVAIKAYRDKEIKLEGSQRNLTILFSDIKGFTFITETLGTDIIKLINMHYDRAIREIIHYDGIIGSIIGDALLAVFGTLDDVSDQNKSYAAIKAAYKLQDVADSLRQQMTGKKNDIIKSKGHLSEDEEKVYQAVMLQIGVGIDGGQVFYGNIGSYVRMTNTVIGDNVNAASRLEGLTRVYNIPVICSDYVRADIEENVPDHELVFIEIDTVQVKGKTIGKKIYWPLRAADINRTMKQQLAAFSEGLFHYYGGNWTKANQLFIKCKLPLAEEFLNRTKSKKCPANWKGIWAMQTK